VCIFHLMPMPAHTFFFFSSSLAHAPPPYGLCKTRFLTVLCCPCAPALGVSQGERNFERFSELAGEELHCWEERAPAG